MARKNDKRNNRRNRQRNNTPELPPFAQMLFGAILGKGVDMIAKKMAENNEETPDIHAEGISNQDVTNINNGKETLSKLHIPSDGSAVEYPIPDNLQFFFDEECKLMVRQKIEGDKKHTNGANEVKPITYDDILRGLYFNKKSFWIGNTGISSAMPGGNSYNDINNCTSEAQCRRILAFNKLQNIAKYLNKGWKPKFSYDAKNWAITKDEESFSAQYNQRINDGSVYFKSEDLANEAIRLMGEDSLNDLFSTDW